LKFIINILKFKLKIIIEVHNKHIEVHVKIIVEVHNKHIKVQVKNNY